MSPHVPRLSIILPAYNEEPRIGESITKLAAYMTGAEVAHEVVVVDDGSSDGTAAAARKAGARVVQHSENLGKGAALRTGAQHVRGASVVFTDADLAYPPSLVYDILLELEKGADIAVGSRYHRESTSTRSRGLLRGLGGRTISVLVRAMLLPEVTDTQAGIKGFERSIAITAFGNTRMDGFAIDVELLVMAYRNQLQLAQLPVVVDYRNGSSVGLFGDTIQLVKDLVRIRRLARAGAYDFSNEIADLRSPRAQGNQKLDQPHRFERSWRSATKR